MRSLAFIGLMFTAFAVADSNQGVVRSVSIQNLANTNVVVWVNGVQKEIAYEHAILSPCLLDESVEVQVGDSLRFISCGSSLEIQE